ncbi:MAG TPA: cation-transporting P-type ATPase [Pyrinomonadaceae bacterium]|nr:cation-transporting P-type ATPase [Pyrinomonadaceae bacterium]
MSAAQLRKPIKDSSASAASTAVIPGGQESHALPVTDVQRLFDVDPATGLTAAQVSERQLRYGLNELQRIKPRPAWRLLVDQFGSIVIALLAVAAGISWATGDAAEAIAILIVLVLNAAIGFLTEWQAGRALEALRRHTHTSSRVRRDGFETTVDAEQLVPGDVIILNAGDRVPADARLLEAVRLQTEESALTGESTTVDKSVDAVPVEAPLAERKSMLYLGTAIAAGRGVALVVNTGSGTQLGKIGRLVVTSTKDRSPLELQLTQLGRRLVYLVLIIAAVVMITGWLRNDGLWLMVEVGISLAVAAVPEGLPTVTTLILALGVLRMARQRAIVRRLSAVETLGSTTVICTDKTGTLTENRMTVREYYLSDGRRIEIGEFDEPLETDALLQQAVRIGVLCNEAAFRAGVEDETRAIGDPTETALLVVADALYLDVSNERAINPKVAEQPFHAGTKRMTTVHRAASGQHFAALKGAPAVVLTACSRYVDANGNEVSLDAKTVAAFEAANEQMAKRALRVLALACKTFDDKAEDRSDEALESGYTFVGLVGMIDPPRPGVAEAIQRASVAGIRTVMLTGDQLNTGIAIARELGLGKKEPTALHARDLIDAPDSRLAEFARNTDVFARVSPEEKLRIVEALQKAGEVVAVTGDGVNDAPALKRANIGVAMGQRGTEVAKEAADVVLADDNFETILRAVEGGRTIYANITKFVHMMFSHNLGEVLMIFTAIAAGWPLPLLPLQILWMNLVTDVFPALALALEPASPQAMRQPPRSAQASFLSRPFLTLIAWQSAMLAALALGAYVWALQRYGPGVHARTIALFALVSVQLGHTFNCRSRIRSAFNGLFRNPFLWIAAFVVVLLQLLAVYFSPLSAILNTTQPSLTDWAVICGCGSLTIAIVELTKFAHRLRKTSQNSPD